MSDVAAIVTAIVAVYAGGLSTYNFIDRRREKQSKLRLGYRARFFDLGGGRVSETTINLEVSNIGAKAVEITSHSNVQVLLPNGQYLVPMESWESSVSFPYVLSPGRTLTVWRNIRDFAQSLKKNGLSGKVKFRVICHDGAERVYRGKKLPFDIESWSKSGEANPARIPSPGYFQHYKTFYEKCSFPGSIQMGQVTYPSQPGRKISYYPQHH